MTGVDKVRTLSEDEGSGTIVQFWPDPTIFASTEYRFDTLAERLREMAYLNRGIRISIEDQREDEPIREVYISDRSNRQRNFNR